MDNKRSIIFLSINYIGIFSMIGDGSVVTKDVPLYATIAGNSTILIRIQFKNVILIN
jgi:acetyltransferase-like isoleucine patch superfamily enzyme